MKNAIQKNGEGRNPLSYLFGKTWLYSLGNRQNIVLYWILFIIGNTFIMVFHPLILAKVMDILQREGITHANITFLCELLLATLVLDFLFWTFHGPARVIERVNGFKAKSNYRKHLLKGVMTLPLEWHCDHHSGDTIDKIEKGTIALYAFSVDSFEIIAAVVQLIVCYVMLSYFSWSAAIIVLMMISITVWIITRFDRILIKEYKELNHAENGISESVYDSVSNITSVIILRVERLVLEAIGKKIDGPLGLFRKNNIRNETKWFLTSMCCSITTIIVLAAYFFQNINSVQGILIGNVYLLFKYLDKISELFFRFCGMYGDILVRKTKVMNSEELATDFQEENLTNHILPKDWKSIQMKGLNFSYHNGGKVDLHLEDISMKIHRGECVAFVGASGSGKTTLLKVIRNLYCPRNLTLEVDGQAISQGFDGISRAIALVPQDPEIFATTIRGNITLGAEYSPEKIRYFTDMACFTDVVESLPKKLDSSINEKGVNLSGGQRQRLALARGLLFCEDKSIILLDEPTSQVDVITEMFIYENILKMFHGQTVISSMHRLHLLPLFDHIYMFDKGRIVGHGNLDQLLSSCHEFRRLWQKYLEHKDSR
ncbi:MAG: ABC transporter ATP-binding protein [Patescibacteria group bacterium]